MVDGKVSVERVTSLTFTDLLDSEHNDFLNSQPNSPWFHKRFSLTTDLFSLLTLTECKGIVLQGREIQ